MKINTFTKRNEDSSCEQHTTIKKQLSTYETSMKIRLFTKGNEDSSCEQHTTIKIKYLRMKQIIYSILFVLNISIIQGQKFQCIKETQLTPAEQQAILMVYQDYIEELNETNRIILIQYESTSNNSKDSMLFIVYAGMSAYRLLELPADCYAIDSSITILLYTKNYKLAKDSIWLQNIFEKANNKGMQDEIISWNERTYRTIGDICRYHPPRYYYIVDNNQIIMKKLIHYSRFYVP